VLLWRHFTDIAISTGVKPIYARRIHFLASYVTKSQQFPVRCRQSDHRTNLIKTLRVNLRGQTSLSLATARDKARNEIVALHISISPLATVYANRDETEMRARHSRRHVIGL